MGLAGTLALYAVFVRLPAGPGVGVHPSGVAQTPGQGPPDPGKVSGPQPWEQIRGNRPKGWG